METAGRKRRFGILALMAVVGSTAGGQRRDVTVADLASPFRAAAQIGRKIGDLGASLSEAASDAASLGILYGTVMPKMESGMRRSILAAADGLSDTRKSAASPTPRASRCVAKSPVKKAPACSRA